MKRRKPIRRRSDKGKWIDACLAMMRPLLKIERGAKCEICGRFEELLPYPLSLFHILDRQRYPRLVLHKANILLACFCPNIYNDTACHNIWHHLPGSHPRHAQVEAKVVQLRGVDYRDKLLAIEKMQPKLDMFQVQLQHVALKQALAELKEKSSE